MSKKSLLLSRKYFGLGDWVMFQTALKCIHQNYPDLRLDVDITNVPIWLQEMTRCFDHKANLVFNPRKSDYTYYMMHVLYESRRPTNKMGKPIHLVESMIQNIAKECDLPLVWDGIFSKYIAPFRTKINSLPYVVIPSTGSKRMPKKHGI